MKIIKTITITIVNTIFWSALHFAVSFLITIIVPKAFYNPDNLFFKERKLEHKLYKNLKIRKWKDKLPQYNRDFNKRHLPINLTSDFIKRFIMETCKAELIHVAIGILGFSSVILVHLQIESMSDFIIVAFIVFFAQIPFIMIQRYNRPRLINLLKSMKK